MNSRSESLSETMIVNDREVEKKFEEIGSAFQSLKTQLEEKYNALLNAITNVDPIKSESNHYSAEVLQKKFLDNYRSALHQPVIELPLAHIQEDFKNEYDSLSKDIKKKRHTIKESIRTSLMTIKKNDETLQQLKSPLEEKCRAFKMDLIITLQHAAKECHDLPMTKKTWATKYPEFVDRFGSILNIVGSMPQLSFHQASTYEGMSLDVIEKMINQVIEKCRYYTQDGEVFLGIIKKHLSGLLIKDKYLGYMQFEEESFLYFFRSLRSVNLLKEEKIVDQPVEMFSKQCEAVKSSNDKEISQKIEDTLKPVKASAKIFTKSIDDVIVLINDEANKAKDELQSASEIYYKDINECILSMKLINDEAEKLLTSMDMSTIRVQSANQDAMKYAKEMKKTGLNDEIKHANEYLEAATSAMANLNAKLALLDDKKKLISNKITTALQHFNGSVYQTVRAEYKCEVQRIDGLKNRFDDVLKKYEYANILPKAMRTYGDFQIDCAQMTAIIEASFQSLTMVPDIIQTLQKFYKTWIDDIKTKKDVDLEKCKQECILELVKASSALKTSAETMASMSQLKEKAMEVLYQAHDKFPAEVHKPHKETYDDLAKRFTEVQSIRMSEDKNFESVRLLPDAMQDYSQIIANVVNMQDDSMSVIRSLAQLTTKEIKDASEQASRYANMGVVEVIEQELKKLSDTKLKEMKIACEAAEKSLQAIKEAQLKTQEALNNTKEKYPADLQHKPQKIFDEASQNYELAVMSYNNACKTYQEASVHAQFLQTELDRAARIEKEKQLGTEMRQLVLKAILYNIPFLWKSTGLWGGVKYHYDGEDYRIPHGVYDLIKAVMSSTDHEKWIKAVTDVCAARGSVTSRLKYRFFHIRHEDTTGKLYNALKDLTLTQKSFDDLHTSLAGISGLSFEYKNTKPGR